MTVYIVFFLQNSISQFFDSLVVRLGKKEKRKYFDSNPLSVHKNR